MHSQNFIIHDYFLQNENTKLPFSIRFDSGVVGPHVIVMGCVHGNELAGGQALMRLHKSLLSGKLALVYGSVTMILGNPQAVLEHKRFIDENLNRVTKLTKNSSYEAKCMRQIRSYFKSNPAKIMLDLHSVSVGNFKMVVSYEEDYPGIDFIRSISDIPMIILAPKKLLPGTTAYHSADFGIPGVSVECGNHNHNQTKNVAYDHIIALLGVYNMIQRQSKKSKIAKKLTVYHIFALITPKPGFAFMKDDIKTGSKLKKNEVYAKYNGGQHIAPKDCYVLMPDKNPSLKDTDAGFLVTKTMI